jgi:hypothetical protein
MATTITVARTTAGVGEFYVPIRMQLSWAAAAARTCSQQGGAPRALANLSSNALDEVYVCTNVGGIKQRRRGKRARQPA